MNSMLSIRNLHAKIEEKEVLKGLSLEVNPGEVHAIMGPNGSGKSSLSKIIAGHPDYKITSGDLFFEINFTKVNIASLKADERAKEGIFLAFQYPIEIGGISNFNFLKTSFNAIAKHQGALEMDDLSFRKFVENKMKIVQMREEFLDRGVNQGFSGGEKKRNEILQMAVLSPRLAILDETDSGLDIDALRIVAEGVNSLRNKRNAVILITHYQRLLDYIKPDFVHVLADGKIIETGNSSLALELEKKGYDWILNNPK